jgi:hypothetical protein
MTLKLFRTAPNGASLRSFFDNKLPENDCNNFMVKKWDVQDNRVVSKLIEDTKHITGNLNPIIITES